MLTTVQWCLSTHALLISKLLCEDPEQEVSLVPGFEGTGEDNVASWLEVKARLHLSGVGERARGARTVVVVHPLLSQHTTAIIRGLQEGGEGGE